LGHSMLVRTRGRLYEMPLWEGPATELKAPVDGHVVAEAYIFDARAMSIVHGPEGYSAWLFRTPEEHQYPLNEL